MLKLMTALVAVLSGALALILVYYIFHRDERYRLDNFIDFHYDKNGICDYITYGGRKFFPSEYFNNDIGFKL